MNERGLLSPANVGGDAGGVVAPQLRRGAIVFNDNAEADYLAYVRDPSNGFLGMSRPLKGGTEFSVRV